MLESRTTGQNKHNSRVERTKTLHEVMIIVVGLLTLLKLQYDHEGHMDDAVYELLEDFVHDVEFHCSNQTQTETIEDLPF